MPRCLLALGLTGLGLVCLASSGLALTRVVPDDIPTLQAALDSGADTVLVRSGVYADPIRIEPEHRLLLAGHPENATRPRIASVTMVHRSRYVFREVHFESRITLYTTGDSYAMAFEQCRLDAGLIHFVGDLSDLYDFRFSRCRISGAIQATPASTVFDADTLVSGTIVLGGEGSLAVVNCRFFGPGETAIDVRLDPAYSVRIEGNEISGYDAGLRIESEESSNQIRDNLLADIQGAAVSIYGASIVERNTIRRCGLGISAGYHDGTSVIADNLLEDCRFGIRVGDGFDLVHVVRNRVLRSLEDGLVVRTIDRSYRSEVVVEGNVVGRSGGDGIQLLAEYASPVRITGNTVFLSGRSGIHQLDNAGVPVTVAVERNIGFQNRDYGLLAASPGVTSRCNDWVENPAGTVAGASSDDLDADPRFCDLARDDVRVASDSPVLAVPECGPIGALGRGCERPVAEPGSATIVVTPCEPHGWMPLPGSETTVRLSEAHPREGGSLEFEVERADGARGWRLPVERRPLGELSSLALDVLRASSTHARRDAAPVVRLLVENARTGHRLYLVAEPRRNGHDRLPLDAWTQEDLMLGLFQAIELEDAPAGRGSDRIARSMREWLADERVGHGAMVIACDIVVLPIDGRVVRAAADRLRLGFGERATLFDFELRRHVTVELQAPPVSSCRSPVTLIARVSPPGLPGEVEFFDGERPLATAALSSFGTARATVESLALGTRALRAEYRGGACVADAVSAPLAHEVEPVTSTVEIELPAHQASAGDVASLVANVSPPRATGEVTFFEDGQEIARAPVVQGYARAERLLDREGRFAFTARYAGDPCHSSATSPPAAIDVLGAPRIRIEDASMSEHDAGDRGLEFSVLLSHGTLRPVTVEYETVDGSAISEDYEPTRGLLTLPPGALVARILVSVHDDPWNEPAETLTLRLSNATVARLEDSISVGTIQNDDHAHVIVADTQIVEGTGSETILRYPVRVAGARGTPITVAYRTLDGWASAPEDFTSAAGTLVFEEGDTLLTIPIAIVPDDIEEGPERFAIAFRWTTSEGSDSVSRIVTIVNDDAPPVVILDPVTVVEADADTTGLIRIRLSHATQLASLFVNLTARNGTATSTSDYYTARGGVTFPAMATEAFFRLGLRGDRVCEPEESLTLIYVVFRANQTVQSGSQGVTIHDDDCGSAPVVHAVAEPTDDGIVVQWRLPADAPPAETIVDRGTGPEGPWRPIDAAPAAGAGGQAVLDEDVRAGTEYWYRVTVRAESGAIALAPVSAVALATAAAPDASLRTGLDLVAPNPATTLARIEYTVARAAPVRVSVIDVQGREVARVAGGMRLPGRHVAVWNGERAGGRAPAGLYFVRCEIGGRTWTRRLVLAH